MPLADPQKLRRLDAAQSSTSMSLEPFQIARHAHLRSHPDSPGSVSSNRTNRLLRKPDMSCATNTSPGGRLHAISELQPCPPHPASLHSLPSPRPTPLPPQGAARF